MFNFW